MSELVDTFSNRLSQIIAIRNIKPTELSEKTGIDKSKISSYMSGRYKAKQNGILILSQVLNVNPTWLMGYNVPMDSSDDINKNKIPVFRTASSISEHLLPKNMIGYETIDNVFDIQNYYALEVNGNSMEPLFSDGDIAIIHKQEDFETGNTCVVSIGDHEITIEKIVKKEDGIDLIAMNPYYPSRHFTEKEIDKMSIKILGKVVEARKRKIFK